jgi:hypothetical protein
MPFRLCCSARHSGYNTITFMSDAVDGRSAARCRNTIVRQNVTFYRSDPACAAARRKDEIRKGKSPEPRNGQATGNRDSYTIHGQ